MNLFDSKRPKRVGTIPKRFIRIWLGPKKIPELFEKWWLGFQDIHPDYDFISIRDLSDIKIPEHLKDVYNSVDSYAGQSDILRLLALYKYGGIYIDTDMMPLKSFDPLLNDPRLFIGLRSGKSFANGVIGCQKNDYAIQEALDVLPKWFKMNIGKSDCIKTGPKFVSNVWFGREDINHLPIEYFYLYDGWGAPKREEKKKIFSDLKNFPEVAYASHFANSRWGGKPKEKI